LTALVAGNGTLTVSDNGKVLATIAPIVYFEDWSSRDFSGAKGTEGRLGGVIELKQGIAGTLTASVSGEGGVLRVSYTVTTSAPVAVQNVCASFHLAASDWVNAPFSLDEKQGAIGAGYKETWLSNGDIKSLKLGPAPNLDGLSMTLDRESIGPTLLQDSRKWCDCLEIRMGAGNSMASAIWKPSEPRTFSFTLSFNQPVKVVLDKPAVMSVNEDWTPLSGGLDILPNSALDFSSQYGDRFPAGAFGWVRKDPVYPSRFGFAGDPNRNIRFYGANLCFSALFLDHNLAEKLAERLMRLGYNSVRIHHYESVAWDEGAGIIDPKAPDSLTFIDANLDKLDYLFAELKKRGLYMTTDLYVNRSVKASEIFPGSEGDIAYAFKHLVPVSEKAMANWKEFSRRLLTHVNPYTRLAYKDDPALALISLINEDDVPNYLEEIKKDSREKGIWERAFEKWKTAGGAPGKAWDSPSFTKFIYETQRDTQVEQIQFLRKLGVKAMLTDMNAWTEDAGTQACRTNFDYVDDHFYWDHPHFLEKDWSLPSRGGSGGGSSIPSGGEVAGKAVLRLREKPFTITEFNYAAPNSFRAEGGLVAGAFAALQDWGGLWRFDYSSARESVTGATPVYYFDVAGDPLRQASEYAIMALFAREDAAPARTGIALTGSLQDYWDHAAEPIYPSYSMLSWCVRLGTSVGGGNKDKGWLELPLSERHSDTAALLEKLRTQATWPQANATDPVKGIYESETGQIRLETKAGVLSVNTERTAGLAGPEGTVRNLGPLSVSLTHSWGTVFAVSLDRKSLETSGRILLVHLTDLKNTGMKFRGADMQVLENSGTLPYLVKTGSANIRLKKSGTGLVRVYRLDTAGRRVSEVPRKFKAGVLDFAVSTATSPNATIYYEIVAE
jgi:hypothetical protein